MKQNYGNICICDILILAPKKGARDQKEVQYSMNKYELTIIASAKVEDEARANTIEKVKGYITRFGGTITNVDEAGKKRFAYEIQKQKEGYYYFIQFDAEPTTPAQVEDSLRIMEDVLRFLCVSVEE